MLVKCFQHISASNLAIPFWWKDVAAGEMLGLVDYTDAWNVARAHSELSSALINDPYISVEVVFWNDSTENGWRRMVRSEPRIFALMKYLVREFMKPSDLLLDSLARAFSSPKMCLFLEKNSLLCEKHN